MTTGMTEQTKLYHRNCISIRACNVHNRFCTTGYYVLTWKNRRVPHFFPKKYSDLIHISLDLQRIFLAWLDCLRVSKHCIQNYACRTGRGCILHSNDIFMQICSEKKRRVELSKSEGSSKLSCVLIKLLQKKNE